MEINTSFIQLFLKYSKSQRIGILLLFGIIIVAQGFYFFYNFGSPQNNYSNQNWLAFQKDIDSIKSQHNTYKSTIYPFNPNFITDFKGYQLGLSVKEIDRLLAFRKQNKFVNSAQDFQTVTKVSDSLLKAISPYFKFPDWVNNKKDNSQTFTKKDFAKPNKLPIIDINKATKEDLMKVYGIGDKISERILTEKAKYGAFADMQQMNDIWGLTPDVILSLSKYFEVKTVGSLKKININNASVKELSQFPLFRYALAKEIVTYRSMNGVIKFEDLSKIKGFPVDKIKIIALYLDF